MWWTKDDFFYQVINRSLKHFINDEKTVGYLRLPFSDLYYSIKELYKFHRKKWFKEEDKIVCYRGCKLADDELNVLEKSLGQFIQL